MWQNPQETATSVTFTEEIFNGKFHFLWSVGEFEQEFALCSGTFIDICGLDIWQIAADKFCWKIRKAIIQAQYQDAVRMRKVLLLIWFTEM